MTSKWAELANLAALAFDNEVSKLSELNEAEAKLVGQRAKLDTLNAQALDDFSKPHPAHWQNGDFLWQTWVGKNARALGMEQAKVRALKEMHKPKLLKAFGRKNVLEELAKKQTR